jgi:hypothetical protein
MKTAFVVAVLIAGSATILLILSTQALAIRYPAVAKFDQVLREWWKSTSGRVAALLGRQRAHEPPSDPRTPENNGPKPSLPEREPSRLDLDTRSVDVQQDTP